jgi:hypothetical protein
MTTTVHFNAPEIPVKAFNYPIGAKAIYGIYAGVAAGPERFVLHATYDVYASADDVNRTILLAKRVSAPPENRINIEYAVVISTLRGTNDSPAPAGLSTWNAAPERYTMTDGRVGAIVRAFIGGQGTGGTNNSRYEVITLRATDGTGNTLANIRPGEYLAIWPEGPLNNSYAYAVITSRAGIPGTDDVISDNGGFSSGTAGARRGLVKDDTRLMMQPGTVSDWNTRPIAQNAYAFDAVANDTRNGDSLWDGNPIAATAALNAAASINRDTHTLNLRAGGEEILDNIVSLSMGTRSGC